MAAERRAVDDDEDDAEGDDAPQSVGPPIPEWQAAPCPVVFKDLRLKMKLVPSSNPGQQRYVPKYGPSTRSHCVVHLQHIPDPETVGEQEVLEFILGETKGYRRTLPGALERLPSPGADWSPPNSADAAAVPRWVTEAVFALKGSHTAEFEPAAEDCEDSGGLFGRRRLTLLEATPAQDLLGDGGILVCFLDGTVPAAASKPRDLARVSASWRVWFCRNNELLISIGSFAEGDSAGREFTMDGSGLMGAMELVLKELSAGSHACARISEEWAAGALTPEGNPDLRGAAIWVEFRVHTVQNEPAPGEHPTVAAALEFALTKKQQGNSSLQFGSGADIGRAARRYETGIETLEAVLPEDHRGSRPASKAAAVQGPVASGEELPSVEEALRALRLNAAQVELKRGRWKDAVDHCSAVLAVAEGHAKASFRRGLARAELGDLVGACEDLRHAVTSSPGDAAARRELARVEALRKERKAEEKSTFGGLFEKMRQKDEAREQREEARKKEEEEQEAKRKKEEAAKKREQEQREMEERRAQATSQAEPVPTPKPECKQEAPPVPAPMAKQAEPEQATSPKPQTPAEPSPAQAPPRNDSQLLQTLGKQGDRGGANSVLPLMPPPDIPYRTVEDTPPLEYEVPSFLRRGSAKKKAKA